MKRATNAERIARFDVMLRGLFGGSREAYGLSDSDVIGMIAGRTSSEAFVEAARIAKFLDTVRKSGASLGAVDRNRRSILMYIGNADLESDFVNGVTVARVDRTLKRNFRTSLSRLRLSPQQVMQRVVEDDLGTPPHLNAARVIALDAMLRNRFSGGLDDLGLTTRDVLSWVSGAVRVGHIVGAAQKCVKHCKYRESVL